LGCSLAGPMVDFWFVTECADKTAAQVLKTISVVDMELRVSAPEELVRNHEFGECFF